MEEHVETKRAPYWKQIIFVLTAGWIVIWIYRTILTPIYPIISDFFGGATDASLGNISSFYFLGYVCMQIPSGILVDRFGKKKILIPGFLLFGAGALIVGVSQSLSTVFIGSILAGLGCGTYYGVAYSLTTEYVPADKKSLATAIVNSGTAVGSGLGLVSSSFLVGEGVLPWQSLLFITAILIVLMLVVFKKFIRGEEAIAKKEPAAASKTDSSLRDLFKMPMIAAYVLYFSTLYTYYLIDTWLPNFLETERGFQGTAIGIASSLVFFTAIPGALFFSRIADKIPHRKTTIIILLEVLAASVLFMTITTKNQTLLIIGIMAYGFLGKLAVEPIIISWLGQFAPKKSIATTYGVFNFFGMSASVIVPSVTGIISDATGTKVYAFYLAIGIIFAGTLIFYLINKMYQQKENRSDVVETGYKNEG
ncbi:MFS transporter [Candidatus Enterococcus murrayae]|uniref:MFS transporter n=1 Tax=Candidatus Enterococcus murrayae TaxID=2815321 RepID=A0ABS3HGA5_9ENTE|nr:MFS transporter [Enterococcus sp. MJM16]MBO0452480.1 MFS transporter [Enterococcus sp. MJM16]